MTEAFTPSLIAAVAIAIAVGILIGVGLMMLMQRSQTGGKTVAALKQEQEDYQQSVEQHFDRSAVLFRQLTDDYRALYEHMASGAHTLCKTDQSPLPPPDLPRVTAEPAGESADVETADTPEKSAQAPAPDTEPSETAAESETASSEANQTEERPKAQS